MANPTHDDDRADSACGCRERAGDAARPSQMGPACDRPIQAVQDLVQQSVGGRQRSAAEFGQFGAESTVTDELGLTAQTGLDVLTYLRFHRIGVVTGRREPGIDRFTLHGQPPIPRSAPARP